MCSEEVKLTAQISPPRKTLRGRHMAKALLAPGSQVSIRRFRMGTCRPPAGPDYVAQ